MENATKALLMAAGILIAIIILSLAIVAYGRISEYYQAKQRNISEEQLAAFNLEYSVYDRDDVTGFEMVSLINKAVDFNQNKVYGANNTQEDNNEKLGDGYAEMSITLKLKNLPNWKLFSEITDKEIKYDGKNSGKRSKLIQKIDNMQNLEKTYGATNLTKLVSNLSYLEKFGGDGQKTIKDVLGKDYALSGLTKDNLLEYEDYLAFKRSDFECLSNETKYKNGQIVEMTFEQK